MVNARYAVSSLAYLLLQELPEPSWAVPGLITEGLTFFGGPPKLGKSYLMLQTALAISRGGYALSKIPCQKGPVLYLALEDTARRLQERSLCLLGGSNDPGAFGYALEFPRVGAGGLELLTERLTEIRPRLVVIDTLAMIRPPRTGNGDLYQSDYDLGHSLKAVADKAKACMVVIHHLRKADAEDWQDQLLGTQGLAGSADTIVVMKRQKNGAALFARGRDVEEREMALSWDPSVRLWSFDGPLEDVAKKSEVREAILRAIALGHTTPKEIAIYTELPKGTVDGTISRMLSDGQIVKTERGRYAIPDDGPNQRRNEFDDDRRGFEFDPRGDQEK